MFKQGEGGGQRGGGGGVERGANRHLSRSDKEVDTGDPREEEDHSSDGKADGIPEVIKDA